MPATVPRGRMVLGAAQFGQRYGNGPDRTAPTDRQVRQILRQAADLGVNDIDTARAYGDSERAIGAAAGAAPRLRIVTKVRPLEPTGSHSPGSPADPGSPAAVAAAVRASVSASLAALRVAAVDTILLHRARDLTAGGGAAVDELTGLVDERVAGRWGVSLSTPDELLAALELDGLGYVQLPFNLLDRRWLAPRVQAALAARPDVWITVRSALLQGLLVGSDPARWPRVPGVAAAATVAELRRLSGDAGRSPLALAIGYVLGHRFVDAVVLGARRPDQLPDLAAAVAAGPLSEPEIAEVHRRIPAGPPDLIDPSCWPPA